MEHDTLHLYFDGEEEERKTDEYEIRYAVRHSFQGSLQGFTLRTSSVTKFSEFLETLRSFAFFKFSCICISEKLQSAEAEEAVVKTLEEMRSLRMKTNELEMYNTELCNLAIEVLGPSYFRSDFQEGKMLANCISDTSLQKLECLDYYSDNREDTERTMAEVLPNCPYLDACFDFKCDWIWETLMATIQKIRHGAAINSRLDLALFDTELPDFSRYFENIPHCQYRQQFEDHDIVAVFIKIIGSSLYLAMLTRTGMLAEAVHYKIVGSFEEFQEFYTAVFRKEEYDYVPEEEMEVFGEREE